MPIGAKPNAGVATPALSNVLVEIGKRRQRLDQLDAQISDQIKLVEEGLRGHISTRVYTVMDGAEFPNDTWQQQLAFENGTVDGSCLSRVATSTTLKRGSRRH